MERVIACFTIALLWSLFSTTGLYSYERMILIEEFTNADCGPCVKGTEHLNTVVDPANGIVSIRYHTSWPSRYDPFFVNARPINSTRTSYYGIHGVPTAIACGIPISPSVSTAAGLDSLEAKIAELQNQPTPLLLSVTENRSLSGNTKIQVSVTADSTMANLKLRVAIVARVIQIPGISDTLRPGSNGEEIFYDVLLTMLPDADGKAFSITSGETQTFSFSFTIPDSYLWDPTQLYVVAFVQDDATKAVLQCATTYREYEVNITATPTYQWVSAAETLISSFTIANPYDTLLPVQIRISGFSYIPESWTATLEATTIVLQPKESREYTLTLNPHNSGGYAEIRIDAVPTVPGSVGKIASTSLGGFLSTATRFVLWRADSTIPYFRSYIDRFLHQLKAFAEYGAVIPRTTTKLLTTFAPTQFELNILSVRHPSPYKFDALYDAFAQCLDVGKKIWILSAGHIGVSYVFNLQQYTDFFTTYAGVQQATVKNQNLRQSFTVDGVPQDSLGDGIVLNFNVSPPKIPSTDHFTLYANDVVPFMTFSDGTAAAIRRILPSGAKIVCTGFSAAFRDPTAAPDFALLTQRIFNWLTASHTPVGVAAFLSPKSIPRPKLDGNKRTLTFPLPTTGEHYRLVLYAVTGQPIRRSSGITNGTALQWDLRALPSGIYFLEYRTEKQYASYPLTIIR